jgi:hypothetical protein
MKEDINYIKEQWQREKESNLVRWAKNGHCRPWKVAVGMRLLGTELSFVVGHHLQHKTIDFTDLLSAQPKYIYCEHKAIYQEQLEC